jgi:stage V sporulation protein R
MATSKLLISSSLLQGDNTIPGAIMPEKLKKLLPTVFKAVADYGCDYYPAVVEMLRDDEISEIVAYNGFPVRYPHWRFGMTYQDIQQSYEYGFRQISEIVINCLAPDTAVLTNRGSFAAKNIKPDDVLVVGNSSRKVVAVKFQKGNRKEIRLKRFAKSLICTPNHKWRVLSEDGLKWKETQELNENDILVGSNNFEGFLNFAPKINWSMDLVEKSSRLISIKPPQEMTLELAELLGILIGDGSIGVKGQKNNIYVSIGLDQSSYVGHVKKLFDVVFGVKSTIYKKSSGYIVNLCSKAAVEYLDFIGLKKGSTYKNKKIPSIIKESSNEYRAAFLKGLFDTDGYAYEVLGFSGYNLELVSGVQMMLLEMGIQSVWNKEKNGSSQGEQKYIHVLEIFGKPNLDKYKKFIGFTQQHKKEGLELLTEKQYCRSRGICVPYLQKRIIEWGNSQSITTYNYSSLGRSIKNMQEQLVGFNCLYSFIERCDLYDFNIDLDILNISELPFYEIESIEDIGEGDVVDIALDHDRHDFIANGFLTHNTNPCYIYCLSSNSLVENILVVAHALGHSDFFKNSIHFSYTDTNMMNKLANNGARIRKYIDRWGKETVTEFIDYILRLDNLVSRDGWFGKNRKKEFKDKRKYHYPRRLHVDPDREYMEEWINTKGWQQKEKKRIERIEAAEQLDLFQGPTQDILGFLRDNAPLKPWQADIVAMIHEESSYFSPQARTKTLNEGWASFIDYKILSEGGLACLGQDSDSGGIVEYATSKMIGFGGQYSMNPYKLGFCLFQEIEERWNKGQFGEEWEACDNMHEKENWDKDVGLGKEKVFEVRKIYDDFTALAEFFTEDFCNKYEFFEWEKTPAGETILASRDHKKIKKKLLKRYVNGGRPDIRLVDSNHRGKGWFFLEHQWDGRILHEPYAKAVLSAIYHLWRNKVLLSTKNQDGEEIVYICESDKEDEVEMISREKYESPFPDLG